MVAARGVALARRLLTDGSGPLFVEGDLHGRQEGHLGRVVVDPGLLQRGPDRHQVAGFADHLERIAEVIDLFRARVEHGREHVDVVWLELEQPAEDFRAARGCRPCRWPHGRARRRPGRDG